MIYARLSRWPQTYRVAKFFPDHLDHIRQEILKHAKMHRPQVNQVREKTVFFRIKNSRKTVTILTERLFTGRRYFKIVKQRRTVVRMRIPDLPHEIIKSKIHI